MHAGEGDIEAGARRQDGQTVEGHQLRAAHEELLARALHVRDHQIGAGHLAEHRQGVAQSQAAHQQQGIHLAHAALEPAPLLLGALRRSLDLLQAAGDVGRRLAHGDQFGGDLVAAVLGAFFAQRHRHEGHQRPVGRLPVFAQVVVQRVVDQRHDHVVERGAGGPGQRLDFFQRQLGVGVTPRARLRDVVEQGAPRRERQGPGAGFQVEGLRAQVHGLAAEADKVAWQLAQALEQRLHRRRCRRRAAWLALCAKGHPRAAYALVAHRIAHAVAEGAQTAFAIDHRVMHLHHHRHAMVFQALHHIALPQRVAAVEQRRVEEGNGVVELLHRPGPRDGDMADMEIHVRLDRLPRRQALA